MSWWCLTCAKRLYVKRGCKCINPDAERIPRLDGYVVCVVDGYTLTEEQEMDERLAWFNHKKGRDAV